MLASTVFRELEALCGRIGIVVREEPFDRILPARSGLCRVNGRSVIVLDAKSPTVDKIDVLAVALARFDPAALVGISPEARAAIQRRRWREARRDGMQLRGLAKARRRLRSVG